MFPDFILGGAMKAGTTAIWQWLSAHPGVFMTVPNKEPNFFLHAGRDLPPLTTSDVRDRQSYEALFADAKTGQIRGEASVNYLFGEGVAGRIARFIPHVKLLFVLREPVSRAFSHYVMDVREGRRSTVADFERDFRELKVCDPALRREPYNPYRDRGFYGPQLASFYDQFDSENIFVILYEDFLGDPEPVLDRICQFLGVEPNPTDTTREPANEGLLPRGSIAGIAHRLVYRQFPGKPYLKQLLPAGVRATLKEDFFPFLARSGRAERPILKVDLREALARVYREDVAELSGLLERDLSGWDY